MSSPWITPALLRGADLPCRSWKLTAATRGPQLARVPLQQGTASPPFCVQMTERRDILAAHCVLSWQLTSWGGLVSVLPVCAWTFPPLRGE